LRAQRFANRTSSGPLRLFQPVHWADSLLTGCNRVLSENPDEGVFMRRSDGESGACRLGSIDSGRVKVRNCLPEGGAQ
jgi:hypothetical protein